MRKSSIDVEISKLNAVVDTYEKAIKEYTNCMYEIMDHVDETATKAEEQNLEAIEGDVPDYSSMKSMLSSEW